jgi:hypothetical protein
MTCSLPESAITKTEVYKPRMSRGCETSHNTLLSSVVCWSRSEIPETARSGPQGAGGDGAMAILRFI